MTPTGVEFYERSSVGTSPSRVRVKSKILICSFRLFLPLPARLQAGLFPSRGWGVVLSAMLHYGTDLGALRMGARLNHRITLSAEDVSHRAALDS